MNANGTADEDDFAVRLEQVELAARQDGFVDPDLPSMKDPNQQKQLDAAARVIGLIQRVRESKKASPGDIPGDPPVDDTVAGYQETPRTRPANKVVPADGAGFPASLADAIMPRSLGRYQIRQKLGQGGYGLVFLALDPQLDREVALKVPRAESLVDEAVRSRFLREAKAAGGLNHANIVPVFETGQIGPVCYIASAYCQGPSLGEWVLDQNEPLPPRIAASWMTSLADAVQHAHARGIIHRDLKPENVLVEIDAEPKSGGNVSESIATAVLRITDFGLARNLGDPSNLTQSGAVLGTPSFISPEQTGSGFGEPGHGVDIYGLGAILYFLLCRIPPFTDSSLLNTIQKVREQPPIPPGKINPDVPRDLEAICLKCLEKQPRHRYQSASELQSDLLRFRDGLPVWARRPTTLDRTLMWCRKRPAVSALAASLLIVLAISSVALGMLLARSNSLKRLSDKNALLATESANEATIERDRAREALQAMTSDVASSWLGAQSKLTSAQKAFLETTIAWYKEFTAASTDDPEDQFWVAQAEHRLAQLFSRLGQFDEALDSSDRALGLLEQIPSDRDPAAVMLELADTLHHKDSVLMLMGRIEDAFPVAQRAVEVAQHLVAADPDHVDARILLSQTMGNLGSRFQQMQQLDQAMAAKTDCVMVLEQLLIDQPDNREVKRSLGINSMNLGNLLARMTPPLLDESKAWLQRSMAVRTEMVEDDPDSAILQFDLSFVTGNLAGLEYRMGNLEVAQRLTERATEIARQLVAQNPIEESYRRHLNFSLTNLSAIYNGNRKFGESKLALDEAIALAERSIRDFPETPVYRLHLANAESKLATALSEQGQHLQAVEYHDRAVSRLREMIDQSIEVSLATRMLENALTNRATALGYVDRHVDAIADWDALIEITQPGEVNAIWLCRATSLVKLGEVVSALAEVERVLSEAMDLPIEKRRYHDFYNSACVYSLVSSQVDDVTQSREHALRAIELLRQAIDAGFPSIEHVRTDPELKPLHSYPGFQELVQEWPQG